MVKATNNIDRILASNKNLVQTELNKINQQKVLYLQSGDKANNSGMLPQDILDFSFQKVEKDNFIPDNLTYSKPTNASLPLLTILQASFERGEDIKLVPTTLNLLEQVLSDPNSETLAKETAVFIINSAVKNGQNIPEALKSQTQNVVLLSPQLLPQNNVNHKLISIIAEGFKDNQVAVKEFSEPILNQLRVILNNPSAEPKAKQDAIFIITEAIKHVGQVGSENLTVPKDLVELAGASKSI
ncbi:hypothetical protein [Candidatus Trichorickettsia mobilis]|uniref:hypothetical protein n=1 Tax=Candidatus Trichorickettsia mobilis TaxID=1346319 RepID=UPI00292F33D3|nr:hypothetical protein [Candidatus Trichorickettsia mobilis]